MPMSYEDIVNAVGGTPNQGPLDQYNSRTAASNSMNKTAEPGGAGGFGFSQSPVNTNPVYGQTVQQFYNQNPIAGPAPYVNQPLQPGMSSLAVRSPGGGRWSSFMDSSPAAMMQLIQQILAQPRQ